ncbi:hypothetical protein DAPPUDRAFT_253534 [Daphnia pulex]|uniref:Uncharacterized protein n=1 Tax=Daphnia pulex TaxID=6669 RepID=E9H529_DAPPU|nr:hypothetical protein DAPPUDRAFT_253534 [Daphnia pulex]|eukprot:EFX73253.1 hypothetical protein DAPPUDRAFT_253534 [Daphnia pulex]
MSQTTGNLVPLPVLNTSTNEININLVGISKHTAGPYKLRATFTALVSTTTTAQPTTTSTTATTSTSTTKPSSTTTTTVIPSTSSTLSSTTTTKATTTTPLPTFSYTVSGPGKMNLMRLPYEREI